MKQDKLEQQAQEAFEGAIKEANVKPVEVKVRVTFREALAAIYKGCYVALPEWGGYWYVQDGFIRVRTKDGRDLDTPIFSQYVDRDDWVIITTPEGISPYQQRMMLEMEQLTDRYNALCDYIETDLFKNLNKRSQELMKIQRNGMHMYLNALTERCEREGLLIDDEEIQEG